MKRTLATLLILAPLAGQVSADLVPGGDFELYKPGTNYTVTATFDPGNMYGKGVGDNITLQGASTVTYGDATTGNVVDLPGWTGPFGTTNTNDFLANGLGGSNGMNVFGTWSGGPGTMIESADPLTRPTLGPGQGYQISVMVNGSAGPLRFDLTVDGVAITPDSEVSLALPTNGFEEMSRIYHSLPAGDVKIVVGTDPDLGTLVGARTVLDDVMFDAVDANVPVSFPLIITPTAGSPGNYDFEWKSLDNYRYDLVSNTDLSTARETWPVWENHSDIVGVAPTNTLTPVPGGVDPARYFAVIQKDPLPLFSEDFDAAAALPAGWVNTGPGDGSATDWEVDIPSGAVSGPTAANSAPNCAGTNIGGYYTENADVSLISPSFLVPVGSGATLSFQQFIDTDLAGAPNDLGSVRILDADNADTPIAGLEIVGIEGDGTSGWTSESLALPVGDVGGKNIKVEFRFVTNTGTIPDAQVFSGFYVDDVMVTETAP